MGYRVLDHPCAGPIPSAGIGRQPINIEVNCAGLESGLFIYPDLGIATVNQIRFPEHTPLNFKITSDAVMNSFFIPATPGGQIYAIASMQTKLHLIANQTEMEGISANYGAASPA